MDESTMPLVVTSEETLLDEALRLCAAVGATPVVAHDLAAARRSWKGAPAVLVCADMAVNLSKLGLARRDGVIVVGHDVTGMWPAAVSLGASSVCAVPAEQDEVIELLANAMEGNGEACVVSVIGGCGGAGASTLAAALALTAGGRNFSTLLLDADPLGGGIDVLLGQERATGMRWRDLDSTQGRISGDSLRQVLPTHAGVSIISWDRGEPMDADPGTVQAVLSAGARAFDLVVIDLPRHFDTLTEELAGRSVLTVLLVPESIHALSASGRVLDRLRCHCGNIALLTRANAGGLGSPAVGEALGLPVLGRLRTDRRLGAALDDGSGPGQSRSLRVSSRAILDALGMVSRWH